MKTTRFLSGIIILLILLGITGCSSGYKAYQKGDYMRACIEAVNRLRNDPDKDKAKAALLNAYPLFVTNATRQIENALQAGDLNSLERSISLYDQLNRVAEEINHSPAALALIPNPSQYYGEMRLAMNLVTEMSYNEGNKALSTGTMDGALAALDYFNKANDYTPGYRDVQQKIAEARYKATTRVVVMRPYTNPAYQLDAEFFYNQLMSYVTRSTYRNLVRFYSPEEAAAEGMKDPHQLLVINFENFTIGNSRQSSNTTEMKRDSVIVGTTRIDGKVHNVYGTVKAKYTVHRLEVLSAGVLSVRMVDASNNRVMKHTNIPGRYIWASEWAAFNGDDRALTSEQLALVDRKPAPIPPPQQLFVNFADPLYAQAASYIGNLYNRITPRE